MGSFNRRILKSKGKTMRTMKCPDDIVLMGHNGKPMTDEEGKPAVYTFRLWVLTLLELHGVFQYMKSRDVSKLVSRAEQWKAGEEITLSEKEKDTLVSLAEAPHGMIPAIANRTVAYLDALEESAKTDGKA